MKKKLVIAAVVAVLCVAAIALFAGRNSIAGKVAELLNLGNKYLLEQDYEQAIAAFEKVIGIDPKCEEAYKGLADAYVAIDDYETAIDMIQQGIDQTASEELAAYLTEIEESYARIQEEMAKRDAGAAGQCIQRWGVWKPDDQWSG